MKHTLCRVLTLALALCLAFSLCLPAFAESEDLDTQLEQAAKTVKAQLGLDTDEFYDFSGDYSEQPGCTSWYLYWYSDNDSLSVTLQGDTIVDYSFYTYNYKASRFSGFDTTLPAYTLDQAQAAAQKFLAKVLKDGETASFETSNLYLGGPDYYFYGTIQKNGLNTPITFSVDLNADLEVSSYYRSDSYDSYVGEVDAPEAAAADKAQAGEALKTTVDLELVWVLTDDGTAQLAYVPQYNNYAVDALTGELTDLTALYDGLDPWTNGDYDYAATEAAVEAPEPEMAAGEVRLSEAEQTAVENLEGVLSAEALDAKVRAISALGIAQDAYCEASYDTEPLVCDVTCTLRYSCPITEENTYGADPEELAEYLEYGSVPYYMIYVTLDAKTGDLVDVQAWSYLGYDQDAYLSDEVLLATAQKFLSAYGPEACQDMELYSSDAEYFSFARTHEGYFYPNDNITLSVNPVTGTISGMYYYPNEEEITFGSAENPISLEQAIQAYMNAGDVTLSYVAWPVAVDAADPVLAVYADYGYNYVEKLALVYKLDFAEQNVCWIDAHSGEAVFYTYEEQSQYAYTDLEGCYGKDIIETLAKFGVGFASDTFRPTDTITQRELIQLLLNAVSGYSMDGFDDESLLDEATWYGFITAEEWNPDKAMTRMEVLRAILNASEYGKAAALSGAYYCSFNDESGIQTADYGYVSIGQALGIIHGTPEGYFSAYSDCTRQDAAIMVYNFLSR